MAILKLDERPRVRVLPRRRPLRPLRVGARLSCRATATTARCANAIGSYLADVFQGRVSGLLSVLPGRAAGPRPLHHRPRPGRRRPARHGPTLEAAVAAIVRTWVDEFGDKLAHALRSAPGARAVRALSRRVLRRLPRELFAGRRRRATSRIVEGLSPARPLGVDFHRRHRQRRRHRRPQDLELRPADPRCPSACRCWRTWASRWSTSGPTASTADGDDLADDLAARHGAAARGGRSVELESRKGSLEAASWSIMAGAAENDGYNALVLRAGLTWRDVALIRTHLALPAADPRALFAGLHVGDAGQASRRSRREIVHLFHARFDPRRNLEPSMSARRARPPWSRPSRTRWPRSRASTRTASCATSSTRCSRRCAPISTRSTRAASRSRRSRSSSRAASSTALPLPRPLYEIFVYSPRVEGVHLRFGKVARGGIRWSDRPQDFRTEVLGLVKAQQVKNAVIVPVGAKGGFVPKPLPQGGTPRGRSRPRAPPPTSCSSRRCSTSPTISATTA